MDALCLRDVIRFASASVQGSGASVSAVSSRECRRCAADVFEWAPAHRLPPSPLPLLCLGLPRRPQRRAGWARDEGGGGARVHHSPGLKIVRGARGFGYARACAAVRLGCGLRISRRVGEG